MQMATPAEGLGDGWRRWLGVVTGTNPVNPPNQPWQATPVGQDTAMPPLLTFNHRNP